jgi:hypothetical protein
MSSLNIASGEPEPGALEKSTGIIAIFTFPVAEFQGRGGKPLAPPPNGFLVSRSAQVERGSESGFQLSAAASFGAKFKTRFAWVAVVELTEVSWFADATVPVASKVAIAMNNPVAI